MAGKASASGFVYEHRISGVRAGYAGAFIDSSQGMFLGGFDMFVRSGRLETRTDIDTGLLETDSWGGGVNLSWLGANGFYADLEASVHDFGTVLHTEVLGDLVSDIDAVGVQVSTELSKKIVLKEHWLLAPQVEWTWSSVDIDAFEDANGDHVFSDGLGGSLLRTGIAGLRTWRAGLGEQLSLGGVINIYYEGRDNTRIYVNGAGRDASNFSWRTSLGAEAGYTWREGGCGVFGSFTHLEDLGEGNETSRSAFLSFRTRF